MSNLLSLGPGSVFTTSENGSALTEVNELILTALSANVFEESQIHIFDESELRDAEKFDAGGRADLYMKALPPGGKTVAIKVFRKSFEDQAVASDARREKLLKYFVRECGIWRQMSSHENIVELLGFVKSFRGSRLPALVSELCGLGSLRNYVTLKGVNNLDIPTRIRLELLRDACKGLEHLHHPTRKVVHRDIKGSNIFIRVSNGTAVAAIGDFGSAKFEDPELFKVGNSTCTTSFEWTPPEYLKGGRVDYSNPTAEGDIWSFGCTMLEILIGGNPWPYSVNVKQRLLKRDHPPRPQNVKIDDEHWKLMTWCWEGKRLTARRVRTGLDNVLKIGHVH